MNVVELHRVLRTTPTLIYRAFVEPDAFARWLPPNGYTATVHRMDPIVGGRYHMSFRHFASGASHAFGGTYLELQPVSRLRYTASFDDANLPGEMQTSVILRAVSCGTEMKIVQTGIPDAIPVEQCYLGWQESLQHLARLVESADAG